MGVCRTGGGKGRVCGGVRVITLSQAIVRGIMCGA